MNFLHEICEEIHDAVQDHHADLIAYLAKELSLDENEAGKDIDVIFSWLQQFEM